jgi:hypothetical protein
MIGTDSLLKKEILKVCKYTALFEIEDSDVQERPVS